MWSKISNLINTALLRLILELNFGFHASRRMPVYLERIQRTAAEMIQGLENKPHDVRFKGAQLTQLIEKTIERGPDLSLKGLVRFADKGIQYQLRLDKFNFEVQFLNNYSIKHWICLQVRGKEQIFILVFCERPNFVLEKIYCDLFF